MISPRLIIMQPTPYCNIDCSYCYLGHRNDRRLMSSDVIEAVREKIIAQIARDTSPAIVWHAGEPTAAPIRWYEHAHARLASAAPERTSFAMQSNGIAINQKWIEFFLSSKTNVSLSIDGPQRFHDARRRTRNDRSTWWLAMRGLQRLQDAGLDPCVITVLHPDSLGRAKEYFQFYRDHDITEVSFSVDELEGANHASSFAGRDCKTSLTNFIVEIMVSAYCEGYPLQIREVERIAHLLSGFAVAGNEQVEPWAAVVVAANGSVSTFSPEFMEANAPEYSYFVLGNILDGDLDAFSRSDIFRLVSREVAAGVAACRTTCRYFAICGGGSPVNKFCEHADLAATETNFCRLTTQVAADALNAFIVGTVGARRKHATDMTGGHTDIADSTAIDRTRLRL